MFWVVEDVVVVWWWLLVAGSSVVPVDCAHIHIKWGKGDERRECTYTLTPKLHATVSVAKQVINLFSISHLINVG